MGSISPEQAKLLLQGNAFNLAEKVKAKKPLSASEIAMLESIAAAGGGDKPIVTKKYAGNQVDLADALGVSRRTIQRWAKVSGSPGTESDGRYNVTTWREWAKLHGHEFQDDEDMGTLRAQQILLQNERLEHWLAQDKQKWIPRDVAKQIFTQLVIAAKGGCFNGIPRIVTLARMSKDTTEACEEIRKEFADIWGQLTTGEWYQPPQ